MKILNKVLKLFDISDKLKQIFTFMGKSMKQCQNQMPWCTIPLPFMLVDCNLSIAFF